MTPEQRFWAKVDTSAGLLGCWPWVGATDPNGYGRFCLDGRVGFRTVTLAHRFALADFLGRPIAPGMEACHDCDNPPCVNPAHLFEGTHVQNMAGMAARGRQRGVPPIGEQHHSARLTEDLVREIRRRAADEGLSQSHLGAIYGINQTSISKLLLGKTWRGVAA